MERRQQGEEEEKEGRERLGCREDKCVGEWSSPRLLLQALMMISQRILLSQHLPCKDSVKTAAIAAKECVIREKYRVVS